MIIEAMPGLSKRGEIIDRLRERKRERERGEGERERERERERESKWESIAGSVRAELP